MLSTNCQQPHHPRLLTNMKLRSIIFRRTICQFAHIAVSPNRGAALNPPHAPPPPRALHSDESRRRGVRRTRAAPCHFTRGHPHDHPILPPSPPPPPSLREPPHPPCPS